MREIIKTHGLALLLALLFLVTYLCYAINYLGNDNNGQVLVSSGTVIDPVKTGIVYSQNIHIKRNGLKSLSFKFGTYGKNNVGTIKATLLNEGNPIFAWNVNMDSLENNSYYTFLLDNDIRNSAGKDYIMQFTFEPAQDDTLTLYSGKAGKDVSFYMNGKEIPEVALACCVRYAGIINPTVLRGGILLILFVFVIIVIIFKKNLAVEKLFLYTFIPVSVLYLLCNPPFDVLDEVSHFCRAYEISEGHMITREINGVIGDELPFKDIDFYQYKQSWEHVARDRNLELSDERQLINFWNTAVYAPVNYAAHSIGILIARGFSNNLWAIFYCGRLFGLTCITLLFYYSIKLSPFGKEMIYLIAMIPMNIQVAVSYSPDGMLIAIICFIVSFVMYLRYKQDTKLTIYEYVLIYALVICISLFKVIYLIVCLTFFLIPLERFENKKKYFLHVVILAIIALFAAVGWFSVSTASGFVTGVTKQVAADIGKQLEYIMQNPFGYYLIFARTILEDIGDWIMYMLGNWMGWHDIPVSSGLMLCYLGLLTHAVTSSSSEHYAKIRFPQIVCTIEIVLQFVLLLTVEYLSWNSVANQHIDGIQGRYLIPMLIYIYYMRSSNYKINSNLNGENLIQFNTLLIILVIHASVCMTFLAKCTLNT